MGEDGALWDWFEGLFKNCNKGIKGRGKDRRIGAVGLAGVGSGGANDEQYDERGREDMESNDAFPERRVEEPTSEYLRRMEDARVY